MKKERRLTHEILLVLFLMSCQFQLEALTPQHDFQAGDKSIILVTFGSSYEAPHRTFAHIEASARARFDEDTISWAYTAGFIIRKLREGRGQGSLAGQEIMINNPTETLEQMIDAGYSTFAVQSLHVIPGEEFDELREAIADVEARHQGLRITVGQPLLTSDEDIAAVAEILAAKFAAEVEEGPVCFMGHGTPHAADDRYHKLEKALQNINPYFFVGTVEGTSFDAGTSNVESIIAAIDSISPKSKTVTIAPLMSIVGDHANNDMNAITGATIPADMSWREQFEAAGYTVNAVMKGLGDYDEVVAIWMDHLDAVMYK